MSRGMTTYDSKLPGTIAELPSVYSHDDAVGSRLKVIVHHLGLVVDCGQQASEARLEPGEALQEPLGDARRGAGLGSLACSSMTTPVAARQFSSIASG
jgi:hypothetical protein